MGSVNSIEKSIQLPVSNLFNKFDNDVKNIGLWTDFALSSFIRYTCITASLYLYTFLAISSLYYRYYLNTSSIYYEWRILDAFTLRGGKHRSRAYVRTIPCAYIYTGIETRSRCNNLSVGAYTEKVKGWLR